MLHIVLYEPEIPGNTGNIIRTCHAVNAKLHLIKPLAFDVHPQKIKRAAAGRLLSDIEHEIHESADDFFKKYPASKAFFITRYGPRLYTEVDYAKLSDIFLIFGRESTGIPKDLLEANYERCLRIPMVAKERSLNLANAVSILTYEARRQQGWVGMSPTEVQKGANYLKAKTYN